MLRVHIFGNSKFLQSFQSFYPFEMNKAVIDKSREMFLQLGIRNISMSDIALSLGISKKTLYQEVDSKESLLQAVVEDYILQERTMIQQIIGHSENAIDEIFKISQYLLQFLKNVKPSTSYELRKYYPDVAKLLDVDHISFIKETMSGNLRRGIQQGLYKSDMDEILICEFYINNARFISQQKEFKPIDVYRAFINYHMRGIVNTEGLKIYNSYIKNIEYA